MKNNTKLLVSLIFINLLLLSAVFSLAFLIQGNSIVKISTMTNNSVVSNAESIKSLNVAAKAYIIYDTASRSVIAGKNEYLRFAPASSAKIMAAIIVLDKYNLDDILVANNVDSVVGSRMYLREGEMISVRNLLYGMMLPSGNDAAFLLAQNYPGGVSFFVDAMNQKAKTLSMNNTKFFDPDGYDDQNFTTAFDLSRLAAYAMQNPTFAKIVGTKETTVTDSSGRIIHQLANLNELLGANGVTGVKTGFTDEAGGVLVTSIKNGKKTYVVVVLGSQDRFGDTQNIIKNAINNLHLILY